MGDPIFDQLYAEWGPFVEERARSAARKDPEPDDFVQHVWERFFKIDVAELYLRYRGPASFRTYLSTMIFSTYINWRRTRQRRWRDFEPLDVVEEVSDGRDYEACVDARLLLRWVGPVFESFSPSLLAKWGLFMRCGHLAVGMQESEEHKFRIFSNVEVHSHQRFLVLDDDLKPYR